jgi:fumiquinazoline A oxidase
MCAGPVLINFFLDAKIKDLGAGSCPCPGVTGVLLGGGLSRLQGMHGLMVDNLVSLRVALWDGTLLTVSETNHPELFWAMRGAGQNFGVVMSSTLRTFPQTNSGQWYNADIAFSQDGLDHAFSTVNELINPDLPDGLGIFAGFAAHPETKQPLVMVSMAYAGPEDEGKKISAKFANHPACVNLDESVLNWEQLTHIPAIAGNCVKGFRRSFFSYTAKHLHIATYEHAFKDYVQFISANPDAWRTIMFAEMLGQKAALAVDPASTAYGIREHAKIHVLGMAIYTDKKLDGAVNDWGLGMRQQLSAVSGYDKLHVYQNYAKGDEAPEAVYGYEAWRIEKLKEVKRKYDPHNHFKGFCPIPI